MKQILFLIFILVCENCVFSQQLIVRQSDSGRYFSFLRLDSQRLSYHKGDYEVLSEIPYKFMTRWGVSARKDLFWTNGENVYKYDWVTKKSILLYGHLNWILEFFVTGKYIYIIYNPTNGQSDHDGRYSEGLRFCRINVEDRSRLNIDFPKQYNATNLSISKDGRWASFINKRGGKDIKYDLILYNLKNGKIRRIDSASVEHESWFGNDDMMNSAWWTDSVNLSYYKHSRKGDFGKIIGFNVITAKKNSWSVPFPERDFTWFALSEGYLYYSSRHSLYRTKDGIKKDTLYKSTRSDLNVLNATLLP